jgi:hypothetical protein
MIIATHAKTKYHPAMVNAIPETDKTSRIIVFGIMAQASVCARYNKIESF